MFAYVPADTDCAGIAGIAQTHEHKLRHKSSCYAYAHTYAHARAHRAQTQCPDASGQMCTATTTTPKTTTTVRLTREDMSRQAETKAE